MVPVPPLPLPRAPRLVVLVLVLALLLPLELLPELVQEQEPAQQSTPLPPHLDHRQRRLVAVPLAPVRHLHQAFLAARGSAQELPPRLVALPSAQARHLHRAFPAREEQLAVRHRALPPVQARLLPPLVEVRVPVPVPLPVSVPAPGLHL